jgi:hypothetical protein
MLINFFGTVRRGRFAALLDEKADATEPVWVLRVMDPENVLYEEHVCRAKFDSMYHPPQANSKFDPQCGRC